MLYHIGMINMAWRNLWRNPRRTWITLSLIAGTLFFLAVFQGFIDGKMSAMDESLRIMGTGHLRVHRAGYLASGRDGPLIRDLGPVFRALDSVPGIKAYTARLEIRGLVSSARASRMCLLHGVMPEKEGEVSTLPGSVIRGRFLEPGDARGIVLGADLARALSVDPGDKVVIMARDRDGNIAASGFRVRGVFQQNTMMDVSLAAVSLGGVFSMMGDSGVSVVPVVLRSFGDYPRLAKRLAGVLGPEYEVITVEGFQPGLAAGQKMSTWISVMLTLLVYSIAVMGVVNTLLMSVMERTREFGLLMALGLKSLFPLYWWEMILVLILGMGIGTLVAVPGVLALSHWGVPIPGMAEIGKYYNFPMGDTFKAVFKPWNLLRIEAMMAVITLLAGLYPIVRIRNLEPARALRE